MTGTAATTAIRVTVADTWQPIVLEVTPDLTVAAMKLRALEAMKIAPATADRYEVKFGGGRVRDESRTIGSLDVQDGSAFIILRRRRRVVFS